MDFKNVLIAIILSTLVLVIWATLFEPPPIEQKIVDQQVTTENSEDVSSPSLENIEIDKSAVRSEIINKGKRINVENRNIKRSISL